MRRHRAPRGHAPTAGGAARRRGRAWVLGAALSGVALAALPAGAAPAASPAAPTFTWNGRAADHHLVDDGWSVAGNWKGGAAPAASSAVAVHVPVLTCKKTCNQAHNDVAHLTVTMLTVDLGNYADPAYEARGDGVTIGGVTATTYADTASLGGFAGIDLPLTLPNDETWKLSLLDGATLELGGTTGTAHTLTVSLPVPARTQGGYLQFAHPVAVGALTFTSSPAAATPSTVEVVSSSLNGSGGHPVTFDHARLSATGDTRFGPLTVNGGQVQLGNVGGYGPYGVATVDGSARLSAATTVSLLALQPGSGTAPVAGTDYPQLAATGSVALGGATLQPWTGCDQPLGTEYTIVAATGTVTGTFAGIPDGAVVQGLADDQSSCQAHGATPPYLAFAYGAHAVTATVVAAPGLAEGPARR